MIFHGKWFEELNLGPTFGSSLTITEAHLVLGAGLFGDFNPLHVNEAYAKKTRFGSRILHGPFTGALMSASIGMFFSGTAIAYLQHDCKFLSPIRAGDTVTTKWTITELISKSQKNAGIVTMYGECTQDNGDVAAQANGKILISCKPA